MARKRQRKKQQTKRNIRNLERIGQTKKQAVAHRNDTRYVTKKVKAYDRKETARKRYHELVELGVPKAQARKMRYWSQERYRQEVENIKRERKRKRYESQKVMSIYYIDRAGTIDVATTPQAFKHDFEQHSVAWLVQYINEELRTDAGAIGDADVIITARNQIPGMDLFFWDAALIYRGTASPHQYKRLLVALATMVSLLYGAQAKLSMLFEVLKYCRVFSEQTYRRLQKDLSLDEMYKGYA